MNDVDPNPASLPSPTFTTTTRSITKRSLRNPRDMSGHYHPSGYSIPPQYYGIDPNALPNSNIQHAPQSMIQHGNYAPSIPENPFHPRVPAPFVQYAEPLIQPNYTDQFDDGSGSMGAGQGANVRARRRQLPGEQVKHRRTRSGCFTCRQRRVKVPTLWPWLSRQLLMSDSAMKIIQCVSVSVPIGLAFSR